MCLHCLSLCSSFRSVGDRLCILILLPSYLIVVCSDHIRHVNAQGFRVFVKYFACRVPVPLSGISPHVPPNRIGFCFCQLDKPLCDDYASFTMSKTQTAVRLVAIFGFLVTAHLSNIVKQSRHHNCLHSAMPESMEVHHKLHCVVCHVHCVLAQPALIRHVVPGACRCRKESAVFQSVKQFLIALSVRQYIRPHFQKRFPCFLHFVSHLLLLLSAADPAPPGNWLDDLKSPGDSRNMRSASPASARQRTVNRLPELSGS